MALLTETVTVLAVSSDPCYGNPGMMPNAVPQAPANSGCVVLKFADGTRVTRWVPLTDLPSFVAGQSLQYVLG